MDDDELDLEEEKSPNNNESGMDKLMNFMKENSKLVIVAIVVILLLILMIAFGGSSSSSSEKGVTISQQTITITPEAGNQLKIMKDGKEVTGVVWTSNDPSIATVDNSGVIKGIKPGKVTITGKYNGHNYKCEVIVSEGDSSLKVEKIAFSDTGTILMPVGSTYQVPIQITPNEAKLKNKIFASSNPEIASIDVNTGLITAKAKGNAMIRVAVNDAEKMASIKIIVVEGQVTPGIYTLPTSLSFDEKEITVTEGETKKLTYHQEPAEASTDYVMWVSADEEIATVFNGELIAKKAGNIEVAIVSMGLKDTMVIHVNSGSVPVTGINIASETNITMNVGDQKQIIATVEPSNATNQVVTYLVDNPSILNVDSSGNISAIGSGSTTITVSPSGNLEIKKVINVTVNENPTYVPPTDTPSPGGENPPKVGSVTVSGTNNAVSIEPTGLEVENTIITISSTGNVETIKYCYYNKATSSTCSLRVYDGEFELPQTTLSTKTTYVIRAIPYYNDQKGEELIRYVTIKPKSGGSEQPGDSVGTLSVTGLLDSKPTSSSSGESIATITVTRSGNVDKFKYCYTTGNTECSDYIVKNMTSSSYTFTFNDVGIYTFYFIPYYNNQAGEQKLVKYVKISKDSTTPSGEKRCYVSAGSQGVGTNFQWITKPNNSNNLVEASAIKTESYCNNAKNGYLCFRDASFNYYFGSNYSTSSTYTYVPEYKVQSDCLARNPQDKCYCSSDSRCKWGKKDSTYTNDMSHIINGKNECETYSVKNDNNGCFTHTLSNGTSELIWGRFIGVSGYSYISGASKSECVNAKCYYDSSTKKYTWTDKSSSPIEAKALKSKEECNGANAGYLCFKTPSGEYKWGHNYAVSSENKYEKDKRTSEDCIPSNSTITDIYYKVDSLGKYRFYCSSNPASICKGKVNWTSSNTSTFKFTKDNIGELVSNSSTTITAKVGSAIKNQEYSLSSGGQISPAIYSITSDHDYVVNFYNGSWTRENYPMIAFSTINGTYNFDYFDACYFTVRTGENISANDVSSRCHALTNKKKAEEHTGRDILGLAGKYTTYKLPDEGVKYYTNSFSLTKNKQRVAFEFGWLTERRNKGQDSFDVILVFYIANSQSGIRSKNEFSRVYRIKVTPKDSSWNNSSSGKADRFKDWTVTDETKKLFSKYYE